MVLKSRLPPVDWKAGGNKEREAKCLKHPLPTNHEVNADTDPFFYDEEEAAHICNGTYDNKVCPFREKCLHRALVNNEQSGTFGGFTVEQRRWIRRPINGISRFDWEPEKQAEWRDLVPPPEFFTEEQDADEASA
jgi:hypothetical protein